MVSTGNSAKLSANEREMQISKKYHYGCRCMNIEDGMWMEGENFFSGYAHRSDSVIKF